MLSRSPRFLSLAVAAGLSGILAAACSPADERGPDIGSPGSHLEIPLGERSYDLYAPETYDNSTPVPAVLVLHGMPSGPADIQHASQMNDLADEEGFLAVYPAGHDRRWSAEAGTDDVDFIRDLIADLQEAWNADPERIYVTGFSNGADMAMVAGVEMPDLVAAVAQVTPSDTGDVGNAIDSLETPVPVIAFLGGADDRLEVGQHNLENWRAAAGCDGEETAESEGLTTSTWRCAGDTEMVVHVLDGQGHQWFGDPNRREPLWASESMWEFFVERGY